jgi:molecular chaperone GrpE
MANNGDKEIKAPNGSSNGAQETPIDLDALLASLAEDGDTALSLSVPQDKLLALIASVGKAEEMRNKWLRSEADLQNYRKRMERDLEAMRDSRLREFFLRLVPVLDGCELAFKSQDAASPAAVLDGIKLLNGQMLSIMKDYGFERIATENKMFNPALHEVVGTLESETAENNMIAAETRPGFTFRGVSLRSASVIVYVRAPKSAPESKTGDNNAKVS